MKEKLSILFLTLMGLVISCCVVECAKAQYNVRAGVKGGVNVTNLYVDDVDDENARIGFHAGVYGQVLSTEAFAVQPELLYTTKGSETTFEGIVDQTIDFNLNYLELPVLAVFKLGEAAEIHLGAYASYLLSANIDYSGDIANGDEELDRDNFKSFDYGLVGGFALNFSALQVGVRYNYGLAEIADDDVAETVLGNSKNSCAQIYLALDLVD